jgi:(p)ppGpp synthase/HD superfamily hydrolase
VAGSVTRLEAARATALAFLDEAYDGVSTPPGKGLEHARAVADVLRENGYDDTLQLVGLLHDVVEDTDRDGDDVRAAFGDDAAGMVMALTEDATIRQYARRKRALREQIDAAGSPVVDVALADKIAILRYARTSGRRPAKRKLGHYRATLALATAMDHPPRLRAELEGLLAAYQ